ncbi:MAG: GNAT family N-acetyltransferase [Treponema sp.]|jgi:ribosomal protein S18 acetylase RimI-like enzyme|nr:GNAT family N-acetyltransferase [Treponema sp.]
MNNRSKETRDSRKWKRFTRRDAGAAEDILKKNEVLYPGAAGRYLRRSLSSDQIWVLKDRGGSVSGLLINSRRTLFPVFPGGLLLPRFPDRFRGYGALHAVQGLRKEAELLENEMARLGCPPRERIDYELMALDGAPSPGCLEGGPGGIVFRRPAASDMEDLFVLQAGYEQEEVLPEGAVFNPASCRLGLERILAEGRVLAAELDGRLVGKINAAAVSFTRCLVGGVYVLPRCRGLGIARRMTAEFTGRIIAEGLGASLFVKKRNPAALSVYRRVGFAPVDDYRISYY